MLKKIIPPLLTLSILSIPVFATPVSPEQASQRITPTYNISIPSIAFSSKQDIPYTITINGKMDPDDTLTIQPQPTTTLTNRGATASVPITQAKVKFTGTEINNSTSTSGTVKLSQAQGLKAGTWTGTNTFDIKVVQSLYPWFTFDPSINAITAFNPNVPGAPTTVISIPSHINGIAVKTLGDNLFKDNATVQRVIMPEGLVNLNVSIFDGCSNLKQADLPSTIRALGYKCFFSSGIENAIIPEGVSLIPDYCFYGTPLKTLTIPSTVKTLGHQSLAFTALETLKIPEGVKVIGDAQFYGSSKLKSIKLPVSLENAGNSSFAYCKNLEEIYFHQNIKTIGLEAFKECPATVFIRQVPNFVSGSPWLHPGGTDYIIWDSVTPDWLTFDPPTGTVTRAKNVVVAVVPGMIWGVPVRALGDQSFANNTALQSITIPNSVKSIGSEAFLNCTSLYGIWPAQNLESVGQFAFQGCKALNGITIPPKCKTIGINPFMNANFSSIASASPYFRVLEGKYLIQNSNNELISAATGKSPMDIWIPDGIATIGPGAFWASTVQNVRVNPDCKSIQWMAFYNIPALKKLEIPASVTSIGDNCFGYSYNATIEIHKPYGSIPGAPWAVDSYPAAINWLGYSSRSLPIPLQPSIATGGNLQAPATNGNIATTGNIGNGANGNGATVTSNNEPKILASEIIAGVVKTPENSDPNT